MIGILCNKKKEQFIIKKFNSLLNSLETDSNYDIPVVVFTLQDITLHEKSVTGWMVSCKNPYKVKLKLPALIFNLAVQLTKPEIKVIRTLIELEDTWLVNITNRYNQQTIMEILFSEPGVKNYVLPYIDFSGQDYPEDFAYKDNFIIKPLRGSDLTKVIYKKKFDSVLRPYSGGTKNYHDSPDPENTFYQRIQKKKLLLIKTPVELLTFDNKLCVTRIYTQKNFKGEWEFLTGLSLPQNIIIYPDSNNMIYEACIQIISYINRFISDIFFCFVDFIMDVNGMPYLLNFGGWDNKILDKKQNKEIGTKICKNILEYAHAYINGRVEGEDYVD